MHTHASPQPTLPTPHHQTQRILSFDDRCDSSAIPPRSIASKSPASSIARVFPSYVVPTRSTTRDRENLAKRESRESTRPGSRMTSANGYVDRWCSIGEKADSLIL